MRSWRTSWSTSSWGKMMEYPRQELALVKHPPLILPGQSSWAVDSIDLSMNSNEWIRCQNAICLFHFLFSFRSLRTPSICSGCTWPLSNTARLRAPQLSSRGKIRTPATTETHTTCCSACTAVSVCTRVGTHNHPYHPPPPPPSPLYATPITPLYIDSCPYHCYARRAVEDVPRSKRVYTGGYAQSPLSPPPPPSTPRPLHPCTLLHVDHITYTVYSSHAVFMSTLIGCRVSIVVLQNWFSRRLRFQRRWVRTSWFCTAIFSWRLVGTIICCRHTFLSMDN